MTGAMMCMAAGGPYNVGSGPLSCDIFFNGGAGPFSVSGASGDLYTSGGWAVTSSITGGTPPYPTGTVTLQGDPSGKLSVITAPGDVQHHLTIAWSGFSLNELETCYLRLDVTDSVGATASATYPVAAPGSVIAIKRTS